MQALLAKAGLRLCAVPLEHVAEVMRAQPLEPLPRMPPFMLGVALLRGVPAPVLDAGLLLGASATAQGRLISLKLGARAAALAVDAVIGVRALDLGAREESAPLPSLLSDAAALALANLDSELLVVLRAMGLVPDAVWTELEEAR